MSNNTPDRHFTSARKWEKCPAQISCRLEHISEAEYQVLENIKLEEETMLDSNMGEAEIGYINAKTELDVNQIRENLRELRQEGSRLPEPTAAEIQNFIDQERFKVEHDPTLSNKERREILKNLKAAEKDLQKNQDGVTGGVMHAWKNGLTTTIAKIRKPMLVGALAGGLAFGLAACGPAVSSSDDATPKKTDKETVQVDEDCAVATVEGDVIVGGLAKNSAGEYCTMQINPEAAAAKYDPSKVSPELYEKGYTDEQLENMQNQAVEFAVQSIADNPTVGQPREETETWLKENGGVTLKQEVVDAYLDPNQDITTSIRGYDITYGNNKTVPPLVYDGGVRASQSIIAVDSIGTRSLRKDDVGATDDAEVKVTITTTYRVDPAKYEDWRKGLYVAEGLENDPQFNEWIAADMAPIDTTKPLFFDSERTFNIGYSQEDIIAGGDMPIRSTLSRIETMQADWNAYNKQ